MQASCILVRATVFLGLFFVFAGEAARVKSVYPRIQEAYETNLMMPTRTPLALSQIPASGVQKPFRPKHAKKGGFHQMNLQRELKATEDVRFLCERFRSCVEIILSRGHSISPIEMDCFELTGLTHNLKVLSGTCQK